MRAYITQRQGPGLDYGYKKSILVTTYKVYESRETGQKLNSKPGLFNSRDKQNFW